MDYKVQLISFLCSFLFGIFFYLTSLLNYKVIHKRCMFLKYLISFAYVIDIALLYVLLMYKINSGVIHIYFIMVLFMGFLFGYFYCKKIKNFCQMKLKKLKHKS